LAEFRRLGRALTVGLAWGLLWACGYSPADYPVRLAVRTLGHPVKVTEKQTSYGDKIITLEFKDEEGTTLTANTSKSATEVRGWKRVMALGLGGGLTAYRLATGFPFGTFDYYVTVVLALLLTRFRLPGFLGSEPTLLRAEARRLPMTVLKAADIAFAACAVLGPFMYTAAQAWITAVLWLALRIARYQGHIAFFWLLPPANEPPHLAIPLSEGASIRQAKSPNRKAYPVWGFTTSEGWSRLPAGAAAVGLLLLALVHARNSVISVPEPGYVFLGLTLRVWSMTGWGLLAFALAFAVREFLSAWRMSDD